MTPSDENIELIRGATLCLIDRERVGLGEVPLSVNAALQRGAQAHTDEMVALDYFEHVGPGGDTPLTRAQAAGYIDGSVLEFEIGENLAWGTLWLATPRSIVAAWMASPRHRENILNPRFRDTGIGVSAHVPSVLATGQAGAIYTEDFGFIGAG